MICNRCGVDVQLSGKILRTEACPNCDADLHACLNCSLYDPFAPNQCREPQVELVRDKEKANFCDYFAPNQKRSSSQPSAGSKTDDARRAFDNLFKK